MRIWLVFMLIISATFRDSLNIVEGRRILVDTDVDTDDLFALLYLLKLNRSEFQVEGVTVSANVLGPHGVNQVYDLRYMMGRDDIAVGVGGEGGILPNGTILPNVGGYLPIIDQGITTAGDCRYRQAIPVGFKGHLDIDTNLGIRKAFLPQGKRRYTPLQQPTAQQVLINKISQGPITLIVIGAHTNLATFLMSNPHLKKNVDHVYIMGGGVRSGQGGDTTGNVFSNYNANPYAEYNIFGDPFAAYQVIHSGIPVTLVPLDATNTIPVSKEFFDEFEKNQDTYEAQYCFKSLKMARETWFDDNFFSVLNQPQHTGRFNFTTQFPYYKEVTYMPDFKNRILGKPVVFDMDMSAGDFLALFYLLKVPVEVINLKAIIASPTGWANAATIDIIYDLLHMMGRDDIKVGIGDFFAMNRSNPSFPLVGDCKYVKAIPHGNGGFLDSDTLFGLARDLPRSPRRYTVENSVKFGAPRDTDQPELRQPLAMEIWESILQTLKQGSKITVITNGPLTNLAKAVLVKNISSIIQEVYVVGGHISRSDNDKGNVFSIPSNKYGEFNMFLDPVAAQTVFQSEINITLIPLSIQRKASSFSSTLSWLSRTNKTPEAKFSKRLLSRLHRLKKIHHRYQHTDTFLGEILGAFVLENGHSSLLNATFESKYMKVLAEDVESTRGKMVLDEKHGKLVRILSHVNAKTYHEIFAKRLGDPNQSAKVGSFKEQKGDGVVHMREI